MLLNCGFCRLVIHKKTKLVLQHPAVGNILLVLPYAQMVWPRQRVGAIRLASTDEIALGISSHHNFRTGYLEEEQHDRFCHEYRP